MKKIFLLLVTLSSFAFSVINEYRTDVYFGNGILTSPDASKSNTILLRDSIIEKMGFSYFNKNIGKVASAYNNTFGFWQDIFESGFQIINIQGYIDWWAGELPGYKKSVHEANIETQVDTYEASIKAGHRVLVVAHSQGNLFAHEAYERLGERSKEHRKWLQKYWEAVSIASPDSITDIKPKMPSRIGWDNDKVAIIGRSTSWPCKVRNVKWVDVDDTSNRPKPRYNYVYKSEVNSIYGYKWKAVEGLMQKLDSNVHAFTFYMGQPLKDGKTGEMFVNPFDQAVLIDDTIKPKIMTAIKTQLDKLEKVSSQWKPKKEMGCACKDKYLQVTHQFDSKEMDTLLKGQEIKNFAEDAEGKIYQAKNEGTGKMEYVRAKCYGEIFRAVEETNGSESEVCYVLEDFNKTKEFGEIKGPKNPDPLPDGLFTAQLNWNETKVTMEMTNTLMPLSSNGCGFSELSSGDLELSDVYPGTYPIDVTAKNYEDVDDQNLSDLVTLQVKAVTARKSDRFIVTKKYQYPNLGINGRIADIVIARPNPTGPPVTETIPYGGGGGSYGGDRGGGGVPYIDIGGGYPGGGGSTTTPVVHVNPPLCQTTDCACLPCEYSILTYLNQTHLGPISGATVRLYKATQEEDADREILYEGSTTTSNKIDEAGIVTLPVPYPGQTDISDAQQAFMNKIEGYDGDFILEVSGGFDIDSNDDFTVDSSFTQVNGKLHLILSKERLLQNDYKVNILTEIAYQVSKDLLGANYDKVRLQTRLDDIAKRVLIEKLYPNAEQPLGRDDLFYWIPMAHKNWLVKPYDTTLEPIVQKVYAGEDIYDEAYDYIYSQVSSPTIPILRSQWIKVDENTTGGTVIGSIKVESPGGSGIVSYQLSGTGSERFTIDSEGNVTLNESAALDYEQTPIYQMKLIAVNSDGESRPVTLYVILNNISDAPEDRSFDGGVIPEDANSSTVAGVIHFDPGAAPIERIEIGGEDADAFTVDTNGTIRVSEAASFDYETRNNAKITVQAFNSYGGSRVVPITIAITDAVDIPIVQMLDVRLDENVTAEHVVGRVTILSNDPLLDVNLSGNGSESFLIDHNGTITVAPDATIDYETRANYVLQAVATNVQGASRPGTVVIRINNVADAPQLKRTELHMLEGNEAGNEVGYIAIDSNGSSPIQSFALSGTGSEHFRVDAEGLITTATAGLSHSDQAYFNLVATATNAEGASLPVRVVVYIDTRRPILGILDSYAYEDATSGIVIGQVPLASSATPITAIRLEGEGSEKFTIDTNRTVRVAEGAALDYETKSSYALQVIATNEAGESDPVPLHIRIIDRDDTIKIAGFSTTIHEDVAPGTTIGIIPVLKTGGLLIDHYELSGEGSVPFVIDNFGMVSIAAGADFDDKVHSYYRLKVVAISRDGQRSNEAYLDITIRDSFSGQPVVKPFSGSVSENAPAGTVVGSVTVSSEGSSPVTEFALSGYLSGHFTIDNQGVIRTTKALDYEAKSVYSLSAIATNQKTQSAPATVTIAIGNLLDTPPTIQGFSASVAENTTGGTVIGSVTVVEQGEGSTNSFALSGTGSENFTIDSNGEVTVAAGAQLDYETATRYSLQATVSSEAGTSSPVAITISIANVPEHVPVLRSLVGTIDENATVGTVIGTVQEAPGGDSPIISYALDNNSTFSIDTDGMIRINAALDYEVKTSYALEVTARNVVGESNPATVSINIINIIDDEPVLNNAKFTVTENSPAGTVLGKVDINSTGTSAITSMRLEGIGADKFSIDANGTVRVVGSIDYESKTVYHLKAIASNAKADSPEADITIEVQNVAEAVPVLKPLTLSIVENTPVGTIVGHVEEETGGDSPIRSYTLDDNHTFSIDNNGTLRLISALDYERQVAYALEVKALNDAGYSDPVSVTISVIRIFYRGDEFSNSVNGTERDETFDMQGSDDTVHAGGGNDTLIGGLGNDTLQGGTGDDIYQYTLGDGNDTIFDEEGEDRLIFVDINSTSVRYIVDQHDLVVVLPDNARVRIQHWDRNINKIETFEFTDKEITMEDFNHPIVHPDAAVADLSKLGNGNAVKVVQGRIISYNTNNNKVDHWIFQYDGGHLIIDTLSELNGNGQHYIDIDGDGIQTAFDVYIYLYKKDSNGNWGYVASDDDSSQTYGDGSSHPYDSYLVLDLDAGEYLLAVGNYYLSSTAALSGKNSKQGYPNGGPYQVTFNQELNFVSIPENAIDDLYSVDHFNFYVLRNDIDPYNLNGLHIEAPTIVDGELNEIDTLGSIETYDNFLAFYPEDAYTDLNGTRQVNVLYSVVNNDGNLCHSLLTLRIIPSLYTHTQADVNQTMWQKIRDSSCADDLNISR